MNGRIARLSLVVKSLLFGAWLLLSSLHAQPLPAQGGSYSALPAPNPRAVSLYNLGLTAYKQGSPESAIIFFKRACDIDPNLADAQYNLAVIYQAQKRYKEAVERFEEVLHVKPSDPDAHLQLGMVLQEIGRLPEAKQHFAAIPPNNIHFPECQRRIAAINNQTGTAIAQPAQGLISQTFSAQDNVRASQTFPLTANAAPNKNIWPDQSPEAVQATDISAPPSNAAPPSYVAPPSNVALPSNAAPPATTVPVNPMPVLANTYVRVIATGFSAPAGLAFDRLGNLYIANYMTNTIDRIAPDGTRSQFASSVNLRGPIGLVVDESLNLYVANYNSGTIARINPAGVSTIVARSFRKPYYLALDREGNLYVSQQEDNSIVRITLPKPTATKI